MCDILNVGGEPIFDDRIVKIETHTYNPYVNTTFEHSDEIRIPIQQQDLYTLPCQRFLYVEEKMTVTTKDEEEVFLANNCVAFMFDEICYKFNGMEIDRNRNVGITTTIKNYVSLTHDKSMAMKNAGWDITQHTDVDSYFSFCVPLSMILGFCEDYKRTIINARHELILIRSRNDKNCITAVSEVGGEALDGKIELFKIQWRMPHVVLNNVTKLSLLRTLENGRYLTISFRSWDLYEFPLLQSTTKHSWAVKTATQLEKPRYVIFALQTARRNHMSADVTRFDHCQLTNVKLYLNSEFYPYDDLHLDFDKNKYAVLYHTYTHFRKAYYGCGVVVPFLTISNFLQCGPLVVIDCSRQNEAVKSATVDVRLVVIDCSRQNEAVKSATVDVRIEFDCKENIPANTTAYCLILHDRVIEYNSLTNVVRKIT
ncbi:uncharacterized protein LOC109862781 [Pseudomyrmex gracilis]|uniref:uncharacterized protein LOC109862781 n=1 Tax=Pseudomyrmex gracilis TaxID=219809 RepID=UPI000994D99D|nr:uncharacterized protein LOC109862781 [Pseudomyrmex gracilis]